MVSDAHEAKVKALTGVPRRDAPPYSKDDPSGYWTISEAIPYEHSDPDLDRWSDIHDRMFPLCKDILARTAHTAAGLAVQVRAIAMAAGDLWDGDLPDNEAHERTFIEAVSRFVGITPPAIHFSRGSGVMTRRVKSKVSAVKHSGFDLVPRRKQPGKLATMKDFAQVDFKPWPRDKSLRPGELISNGALCSCGVSARLAYAIMLRNRDELIDMHTKVDHGHIDEMMGSMADAAEKFKAIAHMLETAYERVLASACAHHVGGGKFKGVAQRRRMKAA